MSWPDARLLRWTPTEMVPASDGTRLAVEVLGDGHPGPTVVFSHGWTLSSRSWWYQRMLAERYRLVLWDQRGHGESEAGDRSARTIDQLGHDLAAVLDATARGREAVLVGHSMGGMTMMSLAAAEPDRFGTQVRAAALIDTSAAYEPDARVPGVPLRVSRFVQARMAAQMQLMTTDPAKAARAARPGSRASLAVAKFLNYGKDVDKRLVAYVEAMTSATPVEVVGDFYATLSTHDKRTALAAFARVATLVVVGERDRLTPVSQARAIAAAIPGARLLELAGTGHSAMLERPNDVNAALYDLIAGAAQHRSAPVLEHPTAPAPAMAEGVAR
ncbi:MAG TPA: alpha/beta hydrolase [Acidimicrobiales bacterium]|nr:alpha/beta hydrolase [Acidimicrobiales bacterium]